MDDRMTILVVSCDKYKDISDMYFHYLRINWPDCNFPIVLATEEADCADKDVKVIKCGEGVSWTKEVLMALDEIESEIVLMTVDDLFISHKVDNKAIKTALDFMYKHNLKYYRIPKGKRKAKKEDLYPGEKYISKIRRDIVYSITIGSSMWRKDELIHVLGDGTKSAWELEDHFSEAATKGDKGYYDGYVTDVRPLLQCAHMVTAGKWIPKGVKDMKKNGFYIDTSKRGMLTPREARKMTIYGIATKIMPKQLRKPLKTILTKVGMKFATKY
ncbi:MAG: hypothetical protein IJJ01_09910 [Firmicutes bacterium]|nr:hypothetical protein [Bacillota bacterium]